MPCGERCRKPSRMPGSNDHAIFHVRGRRAGVVAAARHLRLRLGRRERRSDRIRLGGARPVAYAEVPARADGLPGAQPPVQAGGADERGPDAQDQRAGELPGVHRGRRSGANAGCGAAIRRCEVALQGPGRPAVPALAGAAWKNRGGQVARFAEHGDAQGVRQRLGAHHVHGRDLALRPGHAADPVSAAGRGGPVSRERGFGRRSGVSGDAAHRRVRAQQEGAHLLDAHHRWGEQDTGRLGGQRPAQVLRSVPAV